MEQRRSPARVGTGDEVFARLEPGLSGLGTPGVYAEWSATLGISEGAVRVVLHRLRRRIGQLLRDEIAQTVASPQEIDGEIRHLFMAIAA